MEQLNLFDIEFPIYSITNSYKRIWEDMNVLYIETPYNTYVLDNKNLPGDTLGKRRLQISNSDIYRPRRVYYNIEQFLHSKDKIYIDSLGRCFKYKKTEMVPLKYHKIKDINRLKSGECVLTLDILFPLKVNCRLAYSIEYVGVLHTKYGEIVYSFEEEYKKDTRRKI
jgi:hypothetical protein